MTPVLLERLREGTREEHRAIEHTLNLLDPGLSTSQYRRWLERFRGYYGPIETRLHGVRDLQALGLELEGRRKLPRLDADLVDLGCRDPAALASCRRLPALDSPADAFGCLYVLEGASLGGRIISRHLESRLGVTPAFGARFFFGYGEHTAAMWRRFGTAAVAYAASRDIEDRMIGSAIETFRTFRRWLEAGSTT